MLKVGKSLTMIKNFKRIYQISIIDIYNLKLNMLNK